LTPKRRTDKKAVQDTDTRQYKFTPLMALSRLRRLRHAKLRGVNLYCPVENYLPPLYIMSLSKMLLVGLLFLLAGSVVLARAKKARDSSSARDDQTWPNPLGSFGSLLVLAIVFLYFGGIFWYIIFM
jgi:hypothetical protein